MKSTMIIFIQLIIVSGQPKLDLTRISDQFIGKPVQIFFTHFSHVHLAINNRDKGESPFVGVSRYLSAKKTGYNNKAKITRNGDKYEIKIGNNMICEKDKALVICDSEKDNTLWEIKKRDFGYTIGLGKKCITKKEGDDLSLLNCVKNEDQLFDFKGFAVPLICPDGKPPVRASKANRKKKGHKKGHKKGPKKQRNRGKHNRPSNESSHLNPKNKSDGLKGPYSNSSSNSPLVPSMMNNGQTIPDSKAINGIAGTNSQPNVGLPNPVAAARTGALPNNQLGGNRQGSSQSTDAPPQKNFRRDSNALPGSQMLGSGLNPANNGIAGWEGRPTTSNPPYSQTNTPGMSVNSFGQPQSSRALQNCFCELLSTLPAMITPLLSPECMRQCAMPNNGMLRFQNQGIPQQPAIFNPNMAKNSQENLPYPPGSVPFQQEQGFMNPNYTTGDQDIANNRSNEQKENKRDQKDNKGDQKENKRDQRLTPEERYKAFEAMPPKYMNQYGYQLSSDRKYDTIPDEVRRIDNPELTDLKHTVDEMLRKKEDKNTGKMKQ